MRLIFEGHREVYAIEQTLLALLPEERPVYEGEDPSWAKISLSQSGDQAEAVTEMSYRGETGRGECTRDLTGTDYEKEGQRRRLLQMSFFKAAQQAARIDPPWGSLTGVRPDKVAVAAMELLRAPGGCPWDREQTHESLRRNFLEESCEAVEAIDRGDRVGLCEELGDVLLQVVFQAQLEKEQGGFTMESNNVPSISKIAPCSLISISSSL